MKKLLDDLQKMRDYCTEKHMIVEGVKCAAVWEQVNALLQDQADEARAAFFLGAHYGAEQVKRAGSLWSGEVEDEAARRYPRYTLHETVARDGTTIRLDWLTDADAENRPTTGTTTKTDGGSRGAERRLREIVNQYFGFGPEGGLNELMDKADTWLRLLPSQINSGHHKECEYTEGSGWDCVDGCATRDTGTGGGEFMTGREHKLARACVDMGEAPDFRTALRLVRAREAGPTPREPTPEDDRVKQLLATNWDLAQAVLALSKRLGPGYSPTGQSFPTEVLKQW